MRVFLILLLPVLLLLLLLLLNPSPAWAAAPCELGVYTYDSIAGQGGLGEKIFPEFEKLTGCKVRILASGDAIQLLGRVEIDLKRGKPAADVILGVDNLLWERTAPLAARGFSVEPKLVARIRSPVRENLSRFPGFVPYDFGALSLMLDERQLANAKLKPPVSLEDLLKPEWRREVILEDPRTSSPGLQFLLFTRAVLGARFSAYWKELRSQWLTMPAGWDAAYGLFLKGQAPLVWSYVTSEATTRGKRYRAVLFREGQPVQIEGAVVVRGAAHPRLAKRFVRFLLSPEVQEQIPLTNWMEPVLKGIQLPKSFAALPVPSKSWVLPGGEAQAALRQWSEAIH